MFGSERVAFVFRADQLAARVACSDCCWVRCRAPNSVDDWLMPVPVWGALDEAGRSTGSMMSEKVVGSSLCGREAAGGEFSVTW